jgi:hypothetical protein
MTADRSQLSGLRALARRLFGDAREGCSCELCESGVDAALEALGEPGPSAGPAARSEFPNSVREQNATAGAAAGQARGPLFEGAPAR